LDALGGGTRHLDVPVLVVDDRRSPSAPLGLPDRGLDVRLLNSGGGGPARARNLGWRHSRTPWVSFLDDDVVPEPDWFERLLEDLRGARSDVAGVQGRLRVPLPETRRPTDWERGTAGLETSWWITADLSYRREALSAVGGFDERFHRAFREDADLGLRITESRGRIVPGGRAVQHPVRPADTWASVRQQQGNADDFLMQALHGPAWRHRAHVPRGRRRAHFATAGAAVAAVLARAGGARRAASVAAAVWAAGTAQFAVRRIAPGPRDRAEVTRMVLTSALIPFAASWHSLRGWAGHRGELPWRGAPDLVLFDRDGTLIHDVPYTGDPETVRPMPGARTAVDRLRAEGIRVGMVTNQSAVAAGTVTRAQVDAVNQRVEHLLGRFDAVEVCPHQSSDRCGCRKPAPGMVKSACAALGVQPSRCVVVGDIGSDVEAAEAAGAVGILVPTESTRREEVTRADRVLPDLPTAAAHLLRGDW
jgi:HAD superfamily hydrolase (TIGR01662 family)